MVLGLWKIGVRRGEGEDRSLGGGGKKRGEEEEEEEGVAMLRDGFCREGMLGAMEFALWQRIG